jgi:hypothetical protein
MRVRVDMERLNQAVKALSRTSSPLPDAATGAALVLLASASAISANRVRPPERAC